MLVRSERGAQVPATVLLRQPPVRLQSLLDRAEISLDVDPSSTALDVVSVETEVKYEGYLRRQRREVARGRLDEMRRIPPYFAYCAVPGLSREVIERLTEVRPDTLGQARRIPGGTPAAVAALAAYVGRAEHDSELSG